MHIRRRTPRRLDRLIITHGLDADPRHDPAAGHQEAAPVAAVPLLAPAPPPLPVSQSPPAATSRAKLAVLTFAVATSGIANRLLYKMALVPLGKHLFFLGQLQTASYLLIYFMVLAVRFRSGVASLGMVRFPLSVPKIFLAIGAVEALASLLGFMGAANLPGVVLPLLSQSILLWQVLLANFTNKPLSLSQYLGVFLVMGGVCLAAWPQAGSSPLAGIRIEYAAIYVVSMLFPAIDTLLKERVFRDAKQHLNEDLDLFVVNSFSSLSQCLFVFLLLPAMTAARGLSLRALPGYLAESWQCFCGNSPACGGDCSLSPLIPLLYIAANLVFNITALELIRSAGYVSLSLVMSAIVPLTILAFASPLPFLPAPPPLGSLFGCGSAVLVFGLGVFNSTMWLPALTRTVKGWAAVGSGGGASHLGSIPKA
ncbi:hypothetical protein D9Q98_002527 [Chlorella vulgaris]|uniref:Uncharacterized protein n=1 Tax=Chlorella vulgaris TaxID=3077 RepID=A0A9D4TTQ0_CHLVU|nr:hypothetical protein D9Q98_002527 [Chlorella vulgaris]